MDSADRSRSAKGGPNPDNNDPVKQDQAWKAMVWSERRGGREWKKNWSFLLDYDQRGQMKAEEPLPSYVSLFSKHVPNTSNQIFGSRLSTSLGCELVRLDRLFICTERPHRRKQDPEMLPW